MNIEDIKTLIDEHIDLIAIDAKGLAESRERSAKFLVIQSILATFIRDFESEKAKVMGAKEAAYAQAIRLIDGKNITEKKIFVAEDPTYTQFEQAAAELEAIRDYIKTHMKIFENAHILYRAFSRD
jgi:hypothetical protein